MIGRKESECRSAGAGLRGSRIVVHCSGTRCRCGVGRRREAETGRLRRLGGGGVCPRPEVKRVSFLVKIGWTVFEGFGLLELKDIEERKDSIVDQVVLMLNRRV